MNITKPNISRNDHSSMWNMNLRMNQGYTLYKGAWIWKRGPHLEEELPSQERKKLLSSGGLFIRNIYNFDKPEETYFWYIIKDHFGGMQEIPSKYRSNIRKALDALEIKKISKEQLLNEGYEVHKKAAESYKVKTDVPTVEEFKQHINSQDSDFEYWGCIMKDTGKLIAYAANLIVDNSVDYQTMKFHPDYLSMYHPSYGLIYEMNRYYLEEKKMLFVNDGTKSLTNHSGIQPFLMQKFKFRKAYCDIRIFYQPWFGIAVKTLFPFRRWISNRKIAAILRQEAWARGLNE